MKILMMCFYLTVIFILILTNSCTQDSNPVGIDTGSRPDAFSNIWHDVNEPNHEFSLLQIDTTVVHGLFKGQEEWPDSNIFNADIIGEYTSNNVEFYSQRAFDNFVKFTGTITNDTTMELKYFGIKITIKKGS